jgi:hypothetical protein
MDPPLKLEPVLAPTFEVPPIQDKGFGRLLSIAVGGEGVVKPLPPHIVVVAAFDVAPKLAVVVAPPKPTAAGDEPNSVVHRNAGSAGTSDFVELSDRESDTIVAHAEDLLVDWNAGLTNRWSSFTAKHSRVVSPRPSGLVLGPESAALAVPDEKENPPRPVEGPNGATRGGPKSGRATPSPPPVDALSVNPLVRGGPTGAEELPAVKRKPLPPLLDGPNSDVVVAELKLNGGLLAATLKPLACGANPANPCDAYCGGDV